MNKARAIALVLNAVALPERKYRKTVKVGQRYTTHNSGVKGVIVEVVPNPSGTSRVRLATKNVEQPYRWTTFVPNRKVDA